MPPPRPTPPEPKPGHPEPRVLEPLPIELSRPLVLLRLGYRSATQVPEKTSRMLDEVMEAARPLLAPRAICAVHTVERADDVDAGHGEGLVIGASLRTTSRSLAARLEGCGRALLFAATIGSALEEWVRRLNDDGEITRALLADACGSSAAIALGTALETAATREFRDLGLEPTRRYAPGYGDWELESQGPLLRLVDAARIGITVTADFLMLPAKSISGVIGGRG